MAPSRREVALLLGLLALAGTGCGYRFVGGASALPGGVRELRAPIFENRTAESGLEAIFTDALRDALAHRGIQTAASADAAVLGTLIQVTSGPTLLTNQGTLASYRVSASAQLSYLRPGGAPRVFTVSGSEDYLPGVDVLEAESNRAAALHRLAQSLMREAVRRLTAG